ncbi:MAG TPA: decaprenyl-phosphate phosphoribosyltransferase [Candidatus Pacebacteria bacterium]|nr:decaprenyl-phosphate phosphoribosyltransferase [Candidatus Paceibacterota bacterium]
MTPFRLAYLLLKSARPRQWIKNLALYAALIFSGFFFYVPGSGIPYFWTVTQAFGIFCLLTSTIYIFNDVVDAAADGEHPFKRKRPIASGELPIPIAVFAAFVILALVFFFSLEFSSFFRIVILAYLLLQIFYAKVLKHQPILDVISIATGFLLRIYAGAVVVNLHMNVWFLLTVVSASLFLAVGKRQSERTLLGEAKLGNTRLTLRKYSQRLLDQYTGMFANATWLTYAIFAFQNNIVFDQPANERFVKLYTLLPRTLQSEKLLMLTLPFVIFGVMRYLALVYEENRGESPELVLLKDKTLLTDVFVWGITVFAVIYL